MMTWVAHLLGLIPPEHRERDVSAAAEIADQEHADHKATAIEMIRSAHRDISGADVTRRTARRSSEAVRVASEILSEGIRSAEIAASLGRKHRQERE